MLCEGDIEAFDEKRVAHVLREVVHVPSRVGVGLPAARGIVEISKEITRGWKVALRS